MSNLPELIRYNAFGNWKDFESAIYAEFLRTVPNGNLRFQGNNVQTQFRPTTNDKAYGFWHLISEAPDKNNREECDRLPDLDRCERIGWVAWCIENAGAENVSWWENSRGGQTHVVIWAEEHDFAVILAKRKPKEGNAYYLLKTAYCLKAHRRKTFIQERDAFREP